MSWWEDPMVCRCSSPNNFHKTTKFYFFKNHLGESRQNPSRLDHWEREDKVPKDKIRADGSLEDRILEDKTARGQNPISLSWILFRGMTHSQNVWSYPLFFFFFFCLVFCTLQHNMFAYRKCCQCQWWIGSLSAWVFCLTFPHTTAWWSIRLCWYVFNFSVLGSQCGLKEYCVTRLSLCHDTAFQPEVVAG